MYYHSNIHNQHGIFVISNDLRSLRALHVIDDKFWHFFHSP